MYISEKNEKLFNFFLKIVNPEIFSKSFFQNLYRTFFISTHPGKISLCYFIIKTSQNNSNDKVAIDWSLSYMEATETS